MQPAVGRTLAPQQRKNLKQPGTQPAALANQQTTTGHPGNHKMIQQQLRTHLEQNAFSSRTSIILKSSLRPKPLCTGASCERMSDLLPQLRFRSKGQTVTCVCADFLKARCFAPGCFPCAKSCFLRAPQLAQEPGPFGTGLLCSAGCNPCCQKEGDPDKAANSTCTLVGDC